MANDVITLAHGNGGRRMRELIRELISERLGERGPDTGADAAQLELPAGEVMMTTDGFTVQPLEFPGGDIGSLAVHGTLNDLAVAGAEPQAITLALIIEEGFSFSQLQRILDSACEAADQAGVGIVAGDTKVVPQSQCGGLYLTTTGIGVRRTPWRADLNAIQSGDCLLVSGPVGDHGTAVMLAREAFGLSGELRSDCANVTPLTRALLERPGLRFMRDPTRGGLATVAHEIALATGLDIRLQETAIPVSDPVRGVCEMLGYDPYYLACEGRVVAVVATDQAQAALAAWQALPQGRNAALIGRVEGSRGRVILETTLGGERLLPELEDDPLPRIC